jgi:methylase of polypeptide subunit release factors
MQGIATPEQLTLDRLEEMLREDMPYEIAFAGKTFIVRPGVFSPRYFDDTLLFATHFPYREEEQFLEMGSGTGIISALAALNGAKNVIGIDINPAAAKNTQENARLHDVDSRVSAINGSLFGPIRNEKCFDTIFWNLPYVNVTRNELTTIERAFFDTNYRTIRAFIAEAHQHLRPEGRLLLGFSSTIGDGPLLNEILEHHNYRTTTISSELRNYPAQRKELQFELLEATRK